MASGFGDGAPLALMALLVRLPDQENELSAPTMLRLHEPKCLRLSHHDVVTPDIDA